MALLRFGAPSHGRPTTSNEIVAARRNGSPDPRSHHRLHQIGQHVTAREAISEAVADLNHDLTQAQYDNIVTRVEVIEKVPKWQQRLQRSKHLGALVLPKYRGSFSLVEYAYGANVPHETRDQYYIQETIDAYVVPYPGKTAASRAPEARPGDADYQPVRDLPIQSKHNNLVISVDDDQSWVGSLSAYIHPAARGYLEPTIAVGKDIDALGLGDNSNHALEAIGSIGEGNVTARRLELMQSISDSLVAMAEYSDEFDAPLAP